MSFATEATKIDSDRFMLVEIQAKRRLVNAEYLGSNTYRFDVGLGYNVFNCKIDGVDATHDYSETTGFFTAVSASDLTSNTVYVIMYHKIYMTGSVARYTSGFSGIPDATWEPRLVKYPDVTQSMKNILDGVFTLNSSTISVMTPDGYIQKHLDLNNSLSNSDVRIFLCINSVENNRLIFTGNVSGVSISGGVANINVIDSFLNLKNTASFGLSEDVSIYTGSPLANYPDAEFQFISPVVFGTSPLVLKEQQSPSIIAATTVATYHATDGLELIKDTPQTIDDATTNAKYFVGRFIGTALKKLTFGTITRCYRHVVEQAGGIYGGTPYTAFYYIQCTNFSGEVGDALPDGLPGVNGGSTVWICRNTPCTGPDAQTYQFVVYEPHVVYPGPNPSSGVTSNPTLVDNSYDSFCVYRQNQSISIVDDGASPSTGNSEFYYLNHINGNSSVTASVESLGTYAGLNVSALYINIDYSFSIGALGAVFRFNELNYKDFRCRFSPNTDVSHADAVEALLLAGNLTPNSASITQANTDLTANVSFTVSRNRNATANYLNYIQKICKSTFGVLSVNLDSEIEYKILSSASLVSSENRDDTTILKSSFSSDVNYQDMYSKVVFKNPELIDISSIDGLGAGQTVYNPITKYLHETDIQYVFEHVLKDVGAVKDKITGYFGQPAVTCKFVTATKDIQTEVGDVLNIENTNVATSDNESIGAVIEINNASDKTTIKINELRGLQ